MRVLVFAASLVAFVGTPGCNSQSQTLELQAEGTPDATRDSGEYWMVWIEGRETPRQPDGNACDVAFDHRVDPGNRTIRYNAVAATWDPTKIRDLIAFDVWQTYSDCPSAYKLHPGKSVQQQIGTWLMDIRVLDNGNVLVDGSQIPIGHAAYFTREDADRDVTLRVHAYGAWSQANLKPMG